VLTNLLSNAIKYGGGRPVRVAVRREGTDAVIEVEDRGIGIAPDVQDRIFGRFERAVSGREYGGLGLGLWIVRRIVEAHGGTVRLTSEPERGSTFGVVLPAAP
jgi:signal transduction histidine kinase